MPDLTSNLFGNLNFASSQDTLSFFEAILSSLQHPILILDSNCAVKAANPAFYEHFRAKPEETIGCKVYHLGDRQWDISDLRRLLDQVLNEDAVVSGYRIDHEFEALGRRVMLLNANPIHRQSGEAMIVLAIRDTTENESSKEYAEKIVDAFHDPFLILDWQLRVKTANRHFYSTFQVEPDETEGRLVFELGNGQWNIPRLRELLEDILPEQSTFDDFEVEHEFENIGRRFMLLNARRIDHLQLILLVIEDITEMKHAATQQKVMLGELQHRVKNLLMNVRALCHLTLQGASSMQNFADSFNGRLDAMSRTQDLLVRGSADSARLDQIVRLELEAIGATEALTFTLQGPELELSARATHSFAMTVHELATNAVKYGALSPKAKDGRIEITWSANSIPDDKLRLKFKWREHGLSESPLRTRRGFGTQIIENSLPYLYRGSSNLKHHPDGIECVIDIAMPSAELASARAHESWKRQHP